MGKSICHAIGIEPANISFNMKHGIQEKHAKLGILRYIVAASYLTLCLGVSEGAEAQEARPGGPQALLPKTQRWLKRLPHLSPNILFPSKRLFQFSQRMVQRQAHGVQFHHPHLSTPPHVGASPSRKGRWYLSAVRKFFNISRLNHGFKGIWRNSFSDCPIMRRFMNRRVSEQVKPILQKLALAGPGGVGTLDGDHTLWNLDVGEGFFEWMINTNKYPAEKLPNLRRSWKAYKAGHFNGERMYELMVTSLAGMHEDTVKKYARTYAQKNKRHIYRQMVTLVRALKNIGITPWVVSGSPYYVVAAMAKQVGIPSKQVIGLKSKVDEQGIITGDLILPTPWKEGKAERIIKDIGQVPRFAAGDSHGDLSMIRLALEAQLVVNPNGQKIQNEAHNRGWSVQWYSPIDELSGEFHIAPPQLPHHQQPIGLLPPARLSPKTLSAQDFLKLEQQHLHSERTKHKNKLEQHILRSLPALMPSESLNPKPMLPASP